MTAIVSQALMEKEIATLQKVYNANFNKVDFTAVILDEKFFENCIFNNCNFNNADLSNCSFIDCEFNNSDLTTIKINNTVFHQVVFAESKMLGINWAAAKWPYIKLSSPIKFYQCNLSHSSFYGLKLSEIVIEQCKAHEVDFREGDFTSGSFVDTDFSNSFFTHSNLFAADFSEAANYIINPMENNIKKAKFSLPEALGLLQHFGAEIIL